MVCPLLAVVVMAGLSGCGDAGGEPAGGETTSVVTASPSESSRTLPAGDASPEGTAASPGVGDRFRSPEPTPGDVSGHGVIVPSPSPAVAGDGRTFPGFSDQSTVDRESAESVAIEAMRGLMTWDTTEDTVPGDAASRVDQLVTDDALERGVGGPGRWTPLWWRQAQAAGAWSSADTKLVPPEVHGEAPEGLQFVGVEVSWQWHADPSSVVPAGGTRVCTVVIEDRGGEQTVTGFDCRDVQVPAE